MQRIFYIDQGYFSPENLHPKMCEGPNSPSHILHIPYPLNKIAIDAFFNLKSNIFLVITKSAVLSKEKRISLHFILLMYSLFITTLVRSRLTNGLVWVTHQMYLGATPPA